MRGPWARWLDAVFGVDLRSLALFRIGLALVLLWDLFDRSKSVAAHYTDAGTVPAAVLPLVTGGAKLSIHAWLSGSLAAQWALLGAAFVAALALLLGFHARLAAAASWFLLVSLQVRNPLVSWEGADKLLVALLFWSLLAPIGARYSLDARRRPSQTASWLCTPATALFVLQVCALYWITGMGKTGESWRNGMALAYALRVDYFGSPLGAWARQFEGPIALMSHMTRWLELLGPFLLLVPWHTWLFRLLAMSAFYGFHLGILLLMSVGFFSPVSMVMWLPLLPSQIWDALARLRAGAPAAGAGAALRTSRPVEVAAALLAAFLIASIGAKAWTFFSGTPLGLPTPVETAARLLRVRQVWPMFSPDPPPYDLWPVLRGRLPDGRLVDPFRGGPVVSEQPADVAAYFPSFKWKIHLWWLGQQSRDAKEAHPLWTYLADHLCRRWNSEHAPSERLQAISITLNMEPIKPDRATDPVERWPLLDHRCPGA